MDQGKSLVEGPGGEDPLPKIDLVNFYLLLRGLPSFNCFSFCLNLQTKLEKNEIKLFLNRFLS